jgi:hypothetical protein
MTRLRRKRRADAFFCRSRGPPILAAMSQKTLTPGNHSGQFWRTRNRNTTLKRPGTSLIWRAGNHSDQ